MSEPIYKYPRTRHVESSGLQAEDIAEGLRTYHAGRLKLTGGLLAEGVAIDGKADPAKAPSCEQAIEHRDGKFGLAGAGGHGEQHGAPVGGKLGLDELDRSALVGPQQEKEVRVVSDDANKAYALRLPMWFYKDIEKLAQREVRSVNNMINVLLREAIAERGVGRRDETDGEHKKPEPTRGAAD